MSAAGCNAWKAWSLAMLAAAMALPGCASLITGTEQTITVATAPVTGASCTLRNGSGSWRIPSTPGSVAVQRGLGDLIVACAAADGASSGEATMSSGVAVAAYGNILLMGSVVWAAVDAASGAAFEYPERITVPLKATALAAIPLPLAGNAATSGSDPQQQIAELQRLRAEFKISAIDYQLRLADIAAAVVPATPAATASVPKSQLQALQQLRAEYRISAMEYERRRADLERTGRSGDAAPQR